MNKIFLCLVVTVLHSVSTNIIEITVSRNGYGNTDDNTSHKNYRKYRSAEDSSEDSLESVSLKSERQVDPVFASVLAGLREDNNKVKDPEELIEYLEQKSIDSPTRSRKYNVNGFPLISQYERNRVGNSLFDLGQNYIDSTATFPKQEKDDDPSTLEALGLRDKVIINNGGRNFQKSRSSDSAQQSDLLPDPEDPAKSPDLPLFMKPLRRLWKIDKAQQMARALTNSKTNTMIGDEPNSRAISRTAKIDPVMSALLDYRIQDGNLDEYARLIQAKEQLNNRRGALRELSRRYDDFESNCNESISEESESEEHNPGNPYTIYGKKYRTNWLWNHKMDGNHMNINPYGPVFDPLGPAGSELFFGRKWWYFNQDDYRPFRRR